MTYFERMGKRRMRIEQLFILWTREEINHYQSTGDFPERVCNRCLTESMINKEPCVLECSRCGLLKG